MAISFSEIQEAVSAAFRDYVVQGVPASGDHDPIKREIRSALGLIIIALDDGGFSPPPDWAADLADVLSQVEQVDAAVASAQAAAATATDALEQIEEIAAGAPDAPSIVNKANRDGGNLTGPQAASFLTNLGGAKDDLTNVSTANFSVRSVLPTGGAATYTLANALGAVFGYDQGTVASGSVTGKGTDRAFTGNAGGGTVYYGNVDRVESKGANAIASVRNAYTGLNLNSTGLITTAIMTHGFVWKANAGDVTNLRVWEGHVRHDGSGTVGVSKNYSISSITLGTAGATGTVTQSEGYSSGEIGHPTLVNRAYDFYAPDGSPCVALRCSFRSELTAHPQKFAFFGAGQAQSALGGWLAVGKASAPLNALDANGTATDFVARFTNSHASQPWGVRIFFSTAAPANTTQSFLRCEDSVGNRLHIWSNGNVVNVNNSYGAISDERLKHEIEAAEPVLDKFAARRFVTYRLKADEDGPRIHGVIAQDEIEHSPHLVSQGDDGMMSFNYAGMAVETAQAVQELLAIVRDLQAEVASLKAAQT